MTTQNDDDDFQRRRREQIREEMRRQMEEDRRNIEDENERHPMLPSIRNEPHRCAEIVLERFFTKNGMLQVRYYRETWYCYYKGIWEERTEKDMYMFVHTCLIQCRTTDSDGLPQDFVASRANVSEILAQMAGHFCGIPGHYQVPISIDNGKWEPIDARGKMVCRGQLVDMITGEVRSNHNVFIPNGATWVWVPKRKKPKVWISFLDSVFEDRDAERNLLQEYMGYSCSGDTWAQKGLIIQGPKRSGKGTIGHVLKNLMGKSMVASPSLKSIGDNFGLENMVDKRLCLISDARLSTRQDTMAVIEMLLRIIACDPVDVTRKHKTSLTVELQVRVLLLTNSMPQLGDDSDAINSRFMILKLHNSFYGREDTHLQEKLEKELPDIAHWANDGYHRCLEQRAFTEPESSKEARQEWYTENNPISEFLEDCCQIDPQARVEMTKINDAYKEWCEAHNIHTIPSNVFSRRLAAMLGSRIRRTKTDGVRFIEGIGLIKSAF